MPVTVCNARLVGLAVRARAGIRAAAQAQIDDVRGVRIVRDRRPVSGFVTGMPAAHSIPAMMSES